MCTKVFVWDQRVVRKCTQDSNHCRVAMHGDSKMYRVFALYFTAPFCEHFRPHPRYKK
jgi:hypothetical protein